MPKPAPVVKIIATILDTRDKARKVSYNGDTYWLPRSQIYNDNELPETGQAEIKLPKWLADEKEIE